MIKKLLFFTLTISCTVILTANEVSVFGAGDLNSKNPYGLNSAEKGILSNKKTLGNIDLKVKDVKYTIGSLSERIDGLESIYEGDSQKLNKVVLQLNELVKKLEENSSITTKNSLDIKALKTVTSQILIMQEELSSQHKTNIKNLKSAITKLNNTYVSEQEFKKNMNQFITRVEFETLKNSLGMKTSNKITSKKKSNKILSYKEKDVMLEEAKLLFKKDLFTKALPIFEKLVALNFKPAEGNFYLGEISYHRKKYEEAISYFKISAMLYDKADYMPVLLLHSAISFEKIKDFSNAANFYNSLISIYADSKEAKIATKNLSNIQ